MCRIHTMVVKRWHLLSTTIFLCVSFVLKIIKAYKWALCCLLLFLSVFSLFYATVSRKEETRAERNLKQWFLTNLLLFRSAAATRLETTYSSDCFCLLKLLFHIQLFSPSKLDRFYIFSRKVIKRALTNKVNRYIYFSFYFRQICLLDVR